MRNKNLGLILLFCMLMVVSLSWSVVTDYTFGSSTGTYTEITGGTVYGTNLNNEEVFNAIPIGFDFNYNGTVYSSISLSTNGFVAMGPTVVTSNFAISTGTSNNVIVALNRDIKSRTDGTLTSLLTGDAPNRLFTIQWHNYRRSSALTANDTLNFQINLFETSNVISFNYGHFYAVSYASAATVQCGLRGDANTEFNNRTTTTNWSATSPGLLNADTCTMNGAIVPPSGLIFTWAPAGSDPPPPAEIVSPVIGAIDLPLSTILHWNSGGGAPTGYKVYFGTNNPPTNLVDGDIQTAMTYTPVASLSYSTEYFWQIVPFNNFGDAQNCPVWNFTIMADPTVTTYPYVQNWDSVTAPNVPSAWTVINANSDAFTWVTSTSASNSAPNALRCSFNTASAIPMDDWAITPPLQLTANSYYRISFFYKAQNATYPEKLEVKFGSANTVVGLDTQIFNNGNITNTTFTPAETIIHPSVGGIYFAGFHAYSNANSFYVFLDDVNISEIIPVFNPPQNLVGTTGAGTVQLTWQAPASRSLSGYNVYRDNELINPSLLTGLTYTDLSAPLGSPSTYYVKAVYVIPDGVSVASNSVAVTPIFAAPANLDATCNAANVSLAWTAPAGVTPAGYNVYRDGTSITATPVTALTYADNTAIVGTIYIYHVTAVYTNPAGESLPSNDTSGERLAPPTGLTATVNGQNITLNWVSPFVPTRTSAGPTRDLVGFKVYRGATLIHTENNPNIVTYVDTNLNPGTYFYTVTAQYTSGESSAAGPASGTVNAAFYPPSNLTATGSATNIFLRWNRPVPLLPNLAGYRLYKDAMPLGHSLIVDTTYTDTAIVSGTVYTYYVVAVYTNPNGTSVPSNNASASGGEDLDAPYNLQATVALDVVSLTWTPPVGPIYQDWIHFDDGSNYSGIGTNDVVDFDVAIRFTQTELSGIPDRYITKVRFFPADDSCAYSIKVWTGGTSNTNPGTLVETVPVTNPTIAAWNEVILPTAVPVPSIGELWIGVNCNAQNGFPAGCDDGPSIPYKGNLIYFNDAWDILTNLSETLDYNWNIEAFAVNYIGRETLLTHNAKPDPIVAYPRIDPAAFGARIMPWTPQSSLGTDMNRSLTGYKVYRDGVSIVTIPDVTISNYTDAGLPNGSFIYTVTATYTTGESGPSEPVTAVVNVPIVPTFFEDGFETYQNFALSFRNWLTIDGDQSPTIDFPGFSFTNEGNPMAYLIFNQSATTPAMTDAPAHNGNKVAACLGATSGTNNDILITPRLRLGTENKISLWVKTVSATADSELFRVGFSTTNPPTASSFAWLSGPTAVKAPRQWTLKTFQVPSAYNASFGRFGIKCESLDGFAFMVDDVKIQGYNGVFNDDQTVPVASTALLGNYPNPFNPETSIAYSVKSDAAVTVEIYNLKGQKIKTLVDGKTKAGSYRVTWKGNDENGNPVSSGVYFARLTSGNLTSSHKMVLMK